MSNENPIEILEEELNEEVLSRMPQWFRILREKYCEKFGHHRTQAN